MPKSSLQMAAVLLTRASPAAKIPSVFLGINSCAVIWPGGTGLQGSDNILPSPALKKS